MWGQIGRLQQGDAERLVGRAIDAGINFIDTADVYAGGRSEEITGQALRNLKVPRESVVVATKVFGETGARARTRAARRAATSSTALKASLRAPAARPHRPLPDPRLRPGDADRGDRARARHAGAARPRALRRRLELGGVADREGARHLRAAGPGALRDRCRPTTRSPAATSSASSCRCCRARGVGLMVWSPLAGGLLSGKYGRDQQGEAGQPAHHLRLPAGRHGARLRRASTRCAPIAEARGVSVAQIALAWLLHQPAVTSVIIGAKRPEQLADNIGADDGRARRPTSSAALDEVSALPRRVPGLDVHAPGRDSAQADRRSAPARAVSG